MLERIIDHAKTLASEVIDERSIVVDATCGNGYDTQFLSSKACVVYSFDIQETAITRAKMLNQSAMNIRYIHDSHANCQHYLSDGIDAAMFNLGYLPGSDKTVTTQPSSTIAAIDALVPLLNVNGRIIIVVYVGHDNAVEWNALHEHLTEYAQKDVNILKYEYINHSQYAPFLICIEKVTPEQTRP